MKTKRGRLRRLAISRETIRVLEPRALRPCDLDQVVGGGCFKPSVMCTTSDY